ncbi:hypothetical protein COU00_00515 [Candidatus Falkowbacteria bacterium CG10_big_fil_rev_8_21_14_0_10_43_11]|uniref:Uncharacterized protein n=1 Tax=Candidatus Falkowbacteria bacterium CG10_big_fil_rev_8_21_14_0_10_43_11 TaxID=1974568 RepID=A0A2M6WN17_9BACT|nr:MAG: hypothetical protein COU00_00515 [Candidatus Falkowbacteria bacterium CG10_big_fil_rev_8_21_14_0_10_43_11]
MFFVSRSLFGRLFYLTNFFKVLYCPHMLFAAIQNLTNQTTGLLLGLLLLGLLLGRLILGGSKYFCKENLRM